MEKKPTLFDLNKAPLKSIFQRYVRPKEQKISLVDAQTICKSLNIIPVPSS